MNADNTYIGLDTTSNGSLASFDLIGLLLAPSRPIRHGASAARGCWLWQQSPCREPTLAGEGRDVYNVANPAAENNDGLLIRLNTSGELNHVHS
jgi:hypothetical protein